MTNQNESIQKEPNTFEKLLPAGKTLDDVVMVKLNTQNGELKLRFLFKGDAEDNQTEWIKVKAENPLSQMTAMKDIADTFGNKIEIDDGELN